MRIKNLTRNGLIKFSQLKHKHYNWIITWQATQVCNLRCIYCMFQHEREHPDVEKIVRQIIQMRPKYLIISGGEPTLIPHFEHYLNVLKQKTGAFIRLITNGTNMDRILDYLIYIDLVTISIDGLGEINKKQRGVDGNIILSNLASIISEIERKGYDKYVSTNSTVTIHNLAHLQDLASKINELSPKITCHFNPMLPFTHPLSVLEDDENHRKFIEILRRIQKKYNAFTVPYNRSWLRKCVPCYRQYFRTEILPNGSISHCFPQLCFDYHAKRMKSIFSNKEIQILPKELREMASALFSSKFNSMCHFPCNCEEEIEALFHMGENSRSDSNDRLLKLFYNRLPFSNEEIKDATGYIKKHLNPNFKEEFLRCFQKTSICG